MVFIVPLKTNALCSFDPCSNKARTRGMCPSHYNQVRMGLLPRPLRPVQKRTGVCSAAKCGEKIYARGMCRKHYTPLSKNRPSRKRLTRQQRGKLSKAEKTLVYRCFAYGITPQKLARLRSKQQDRCAVCRKKTVLTIDHCHKTQKVRGLLCDACNKAIGFFEESPERLRAARNYLNRNVSRNNFSTLPNESKGVVSREIRKRDLVY